MRLLLIVALLITSCGAEEFKTEYIEKDYVSVCNLTEVAATKYIQKVSDFTDNDLADEELAEGEANWICKASSNEMLFAICNENPELSIWVSGEQILLYEIQGYERCQTIESIPSNELINLRK